MIFALKEVYKAYAGSHHLIQTYHTSFYKVALALRPLQGNKLEAQHIKPEQVLLVTSAPSQSNYSFYLFMHLAISAGQHLAAVTKT